MEMKQIMKRLGIMLLTLCLLVGMVGCGSSGSSSDANRQDAEKIKEDNQSAEESSEVASTEAEVKVTKHTEYPLTITTYDNQGNEIETTYKKAPEKVVAVYQGCIETMLALGLEDRLVATAGLDNEVPDELKEAFSKTNYLDEFTPSKETITMLEPDMIFS